MKKNSHLTQGHSVKAIAGLSIALCSSSFGANILLNGGFESGSGTDADNWGEIGSSSNGSAIRSTSNPNTGLAHAYMNVDNTVTTAGVAVFVEQNQGANTIDNTQNFDLSFLARVDNLDFTGINMFAQILWLDQDGSHGGGVKSETLESLIGFGPGLSTDYQGFTLADLDPADGADSFLVRFQLSAGAIPGIQNGLYVDDVVLEAVPEPTSSALLALGALGCVLRRRRSQ